MNNREKSRRLRELIQAEETLVMPDAFDPVSGMEDIAALLKRV